LKDLPASIANFFSCAQLLRSGQKSKIKAKKFANKWELAFVVNFLTQKTFFYWWSSHSYTQKRNKSFKKSCMAAYPVSIQNLEPIVSWHTHWMIVTKKSRKMVLIKKNSSGIQ